MVRYYVGLVSVDLLGYRFGGDAEGAGVSNSFTFVGQVLYKEPGVSY